MTRFLKFITLEKSNTLKELFKSLMRDYIELSL